MAARIYDVVLLGANGFTGVHTAEKIVTQLPTNLRWAVAGRSLTKMQSLTKTLAQNYPDRAVPAVEVVQLQSRDLHDLAQKTKIILNCVGPYCLYGTEVVDACAHNGTHYLDVTGESPWVKTVFERYHAVAQKTGAIIIPEIGIESAPSDIVAFLLADFIKTHKGAPVSQVINSVYTLKGALSGGSLRTVFTLFDVFGIKEFADAMRHDSMSLKPAPPRHESLLRALIGTHSVPGLGQLTTFSFGQNDVPIVYRSWSLLGYGPQFQFSFYLHVQNAFIGFVVHLASVAVGLVLIIPPVRWLLSRLVPYHPGQGPTPEESSRQRGEWRAIAHADCVPSKTAYCRLRWEGALYGMTGALLAHGAATLLYDDRDNVPAKAIGGGCLTPATLGACFVARLEAAGLTTETEWLHS